MLIDMRRFNRSVLNSLSLLSLIVLIAMLFLSADLFANDALIVQRRDGVAVRFEVEYARDAATHRRGLMGRDHLDQRSGMFFDFRRTQHIRMWMKHTLIPLDILFVAESGTIVYIARNTTPLSLDVIEAAEPVRYVLEINAEETQELGIRLGDRILLDAARSAQH